MINAEVKVPQMVEKAGENRYILSIGEAIGSKSTLYSEKERVLPVDLEYPQYNKYVVTVNIPEGYKLMDSNALRMRVEETDKDNGNTLAYFSSDYKIEGKTLTVRVSESYPKIHYAVSEYQDFRKVVNAAADFNKMAVVLEKAKPKYKPRPKTAAKMNNLAVKPAAAAKPMALKEQIKPKNADPKRKPVVQKAEPAAPKPQPVVKPTIVKPGAGGGYGPQTGNNGVKHK